MSVLLMLEPFLKSRRHIPLAPEVTRQLRVPGCSGRGTGGGPFWTLPLAPTGDVLEAC